MYSPDPNNLTDLDLYWAGFFRADGHHCSRSSRLKFTQAQPEPVSMFVQYLGLPEARHRSNEAVSHTGRKYTAHSVSCGHLHSAYTELQVKHEQAREDLYLSPHFWRGMVDGDGYVTLYPNGIGVTLGLCGTLFDVGSFVTFMSAATGRQGLGVHKHGSIWRTHIGGDSCKDLLSILYEDQFSANLPKKTRALEGISRRRSGIRKY